jgi:hypothetical protein
LSAAGVGDTITISVFPPDVGNRDDPGEGVVMADRKWRDLNPRQRGAVVVGGTVQLALALTAWYDLSHRPRHLVNGPKAVWALVIAINFVGPIVYFRFGRAATHHVSRHATDILGWH